MHVMTKYLDTRKAAIEALQDYPLMEQTAAQDISQEAEWLRSEVASPASPRLDGMPGASDSHAGEQRIANTLDQINLMGQRQAQAREYLEWFTPAWESLSDDDRRVLDGFFFGDDTQEEKVQALADNLYVERDTVYRRKNRALGRLATALYGRL